MAQVIDGKALASKLQGRLVEKVNRLKAEHGIVPGLVVLLVGEDPASQVYVRNKERAALAAGFKSEVVRLPDTISQAELLAVIAHYNQEVTCHGILVQLPLPKQIDTDAVLLAISPEKDVDGFHPLNMGRLWSGNPLMLPCTPAGVMTMLDAYGIAVSGKKAVVVGASNIVGKPMAQLLLARGATVTICHVLTENLKAETQTADILVVAIGCGHFITSDFIKEGAVVIDVGINKTAEGNIIGDVKYDEVSEVASFISPVPGGVGPMTITMLLEQTYHSALRALDLPLDD